MSKLPANSPVIIKNTMVPTYFRVLSSNLPIFSFYIDIFRNIKYP